jgi:hypothetical protein
VWMGNNNQDPLSNALGEGLFSADGPLYLWHDFMEIALNRRWDWNGRRPVAQTDFPQPTGVVVKEVCKFSGMTPGSSGCQTREIPFLEGTVPPTDNVHSKGCFDIVQEIREDDRRPQEWIDSAALWADRVVNGQTGSVGDPTELKEHPEYHLAIAPVLGNTSYGNPICGELRVTPKPSKSPHGSPGPSGPNPSESCQGNPRKCSPQPTLPVNDEGPAAGAAGTDTTIILPAFMLSLLTWLVPLAANLARRRRRRNR